MISWIVFSLGFGWISPLSRKSFHCSANIVFFPADSILFLHTLYADMMVRLGCFGRFSVTATNRPNGSNCVVAIAEAHFPTTTMRIPSLLDALLKYIAFCVAITLAWPKCC